ncbi:MAG TPA: MFS transporter [Anaerolineae bacterium]|nr:MFS transporter [Anaerolineae bacterium]HQH37485.1 MFS transporter [Anaerolineae bacterium]
MNQLSGRSSGWRIQSMPRYLPWYLVHHGLNAVFYMLTFGSSMFVLFLSDLGLDKARIGFLLSLFPFCGLVAPFVSGFVGRFGLKRTYVTFYGVRKLVMLLMLAAPWVLERWGTMALFGYTVVVLFIFAMLRATAETAYYPWAREFIPDAVRGRVSGMNNVVIGLASALVMLAASWVLSQGTGYARYQVLIGVACAAGLVSVLCATALPAEHPAPSPSTRELWRAMHAALHDRRFVGFLLGVMTSLLAMASYPFLPLFARERLLIPEGQIVLFDVANTVGALVMSLYWGWAADRYGGKPLTLLTLGVLGVLPALWLALPPGREVTLALGLVLAFTAGAINVGLGIGSFRWLLNDVVPMEARTAYTSIWYAGSGLAGGVAPFLAGWLLRVLTGLDAVVAGVQIHAFTVLFVWTLVMTSVALGFYARVPAGADQRLRDYLRATVTHDVPRIFRRLWRRRNSSEEAT